LKNAPSHVTQYGTSFQIPELQRSVIQTLPMAPKQPTFLVTINGIECEAIADSGCAVTIISTAIAKRVKAVINKDSGMCIYAANGKQIKLAGRTKIKVGTLGVKAQVPCLVAEDDSDRILISYLFFQTIGIVLDCYHNLIINWVAKSSTECTIIDYKTIACQYIKEKAIRQNNIVLSNGLLEHTVYRVDIDRFLDSINRSKKELLDFIFQFLNKCANCKSKKCIEHKVYTTFEQLLGAPDNFSEPSIDEGDINDEQSEVSVSSDSSSDSSITGSVGENQTIPKTIDDSQRAVKDSDSDSGSEGKLQHKTRSKSQKRIDKETRDYFTKCSKLDPSDINFVCAFRTATDIELGPKEMASIPVICDYNNDRGVLTCDVRLVASKARRYNIVMRNSITTTDRQFLEIRNLIRAKVRIPKGVALYAATPVEELYENICMLDSEGEPRVQEIRISKPNEQLMNSSNEAQLERKQFEEIRSSWGDICQVYVEQCDFSISYTSLPYTYDRNDDQCAKILRCVSKSVPTLREPVSPHYDFDKMDIGEQLTPEQRLKLKSVVDKYADRFAHNLSELGSGAKWDPIEIKTGDNRPCKAQVRRVSEDDRRAIENEIKEMLSHGLIVPVRSQWSSPIHLVKGKNGKTRFCVDYRTLNSLTIKNNYPLPRIDENIDMFKGCKYISIWDCISGYFQLKMHPNSIEKTAFCSSLGLFAFTRHPFGLTNGPADFCQFINYYFSDLRPYGVILYLDDIAIATETFESHLEAIEHTLITVGDAGLKLKASKCSFAKNSCKYLGFTISADGVNIHDEKVRVIRDWPPPTTRKKLQSFLGHTVFVSRFFRKSS